LEKERNIREFQRVSSAEKWKVKIGIVTGFVEVEDFSDGQIIKNPYTTCLRTDAAINFAGRLWNVTRSQVARCVRVRALATPRRTDPVKKGLHPI
jgi:hypothetical protein